MSTAHAHHTLNPSLHQRRAALYHRAQILQTQGEITGFIRVQGTPRVKAGYRIKSGLYWSDRLSLAKAEARLADLWNGR